MHAGERCAEYYSEAHISVDIQSVLHRAMKRCGYALHLSPVMHNRKAIEADLLFYHTHNHHK